MGFWEEVGVTFKGKLREKNVSWVRWDVVCYHIKRGRLGIKNLLFNKTLLGKWLWRMLINNRESLRRDILVRKYDF